MNSVLSTDDLLHVNQSPTLKEFNTYNCLKLWIKERNCQALNSRFAELEAVCKQQHKSGEINTAVVDSVKKFIALMLMDQGVLEFTQKGAREQQLKKSIYANKGQVAAIIYTYYLGNNIHQSTHSKNSVDVKKLLAANDTLEQKIENLQKQKATIKKQHTVSAQNTSTLHLG